MSIPNTLELQGKTQALAASAVVTLWVLDASNLPGGVTFRFCPMTDEWREPIAWQGVEYTPLPMEAKGFEFRGQGAPPRPKIAFGNVGGQFSQLCIALKDMVGARVIRKRTLARYLDGRENANPNIYFPDDIFHIEQKTAENKSAVEFELGTAMDVDDVELPKRLVISGTCMWGYRGAECGYAGNTAIAKVDGTEFADPRNFQGAWVSTTLYFTGDVTFIILPDTRRQYYRLASDGGGAGVIGTGSRPGDDARWEADECGRHTADCYLRFGATSSGLPFSGFPAANRQKG